MEGSNLPEGAAATRRWPLLGVLAVLVATTLMNNAVAPGGYLLWACLGIAGVVLLARADGLRPRDLGLGPVTGRAARAAVVLAALTAAAMLVGTQLPGIASAYLDERVAGMGGGQAAFAALAGAFLCLLRIRYDHLVAPLAVHGTANSLAYLLAWLMLRP